MIAICGIQKFLKKGGLSKKVFGVKLVWMMISATITSLTAIKLWELPAVMENVGFNGGIG